MEEAQVEPDLGRNVEHIRVKCGSWRQVDSQWMNVGNLQELSVHVKLEALI